MAQLRAIVTSNIRLCAFRETAKRHGQLHPREHARPAWRPNAGVRHFWKRVQHDRSPLPPWHLHGWRDLEGLAYHRVHHICPTLPGWGNTSPSLPHTPYVDCLTSDMTALLDHLYPDCGRDIKLYVAGGSFGTVQAQILYSAPYDKFPYGRCIVGVLLMAAFTPFRYHKDYAKHMTWSNYFLVGPLSQWLPFKGLRIRLITMAMARKVSTVDEAEKFLRGFIFDKMDAAEKEEYAQWRAKEGIAEGETERRLAENIVRSVAKSWEGFKLGPSILHSDWGFRPDALDGEHPRPFVMLITSLGDKEVPREWTQYLATTYKNTKVKTLRGGHLGALYHLDDIWAEFLADVE